MKENLYDLMGDIAKWSDETFGSVSDQGKRILPMVNHLREEVFELGYAIDDLQNNEVSDAEDIEDINKEKFEQVEMELADCFMLLLNITAHLDLNDEDILRLVRLKLEYNKKRSWGNSDQNGVIHHK